MIDIQPIRSVWERYQRLDPNLRFTLGLLKIFAFAWLIRIIGLEWGGKYGDERIDFSVKVLAGQLVPPQHFYPPLNNYLNAVSIAIMFVGARLTGLLSNTTELRQLYFEDPMPFFYASRIYTALIGALTAPAGALTARAFGVSRFNSQIVALVMALLPVSVWWSHVAKPQMGMTAGCIFLALAAVSFLNQPSSKALAVAVGASAAVAQAFKHNAIFLVLPILIGLVIVALRESKASRETIIKRAGLAIAIGIVTWSITSIGILLDFRNFIEYQAIQAQMSERPSGLFIFLSSGLPLLGSLTGGATPFILLGFVTVPVFFRDNKTLLLWISTVVGLFIVNAITGDRVVPGLFLPFSSLIVLLTVVTLGRLAEDERSLHRRLGQVGLAISLASTFVGSAMVLQQALAYPAKKEIAKVLTEHALPNKTRILAADIDKTGVVQSFEARRAERARHERLAQKYKISLPPAAAEHANRRPDRLNTYFTFPIPYVIHGLEHVDENDVAAIKPFVWPRQKEEWSLDYWLERHYSIFVVRKEWWMLTRAEPPVISFHKEIKSRCDLLHVVPPRRPLFWELEYRIYKCAGG